MNSSLLILNYNSSVDLFIFLFAVLQQAWPGGTQQILLPSTWQQLPGVALHNSVQPTAVIPETIGSNQQLADWRQVSYEVSIWNISWEGSSDFSLNFWS